MTNDPSPMPHQVILDDRRRLSVSGVSDVDSFDDNTVIAHTALGDLTVKGQHLHICRLNTDNGDLLLEGQIELLEYSEPRLKGQRFRRWFK